jgi:hypothetical protein
MRPVVTHMMMRTPTTVLATEPSPPEKEVPPSRTTMMQSVSMPSPESGIAQRHEAGPGHPREGGEDAHDDIEDPDVLHRADPESSAALRFPPIAAAYLPRIVFRCTMTRETMRKSAT